ncbi:hypothetical protein GCM10028864_28900 [Microlunatus parietis]
MFCDPRRAAALGLLVGATTALVASVGYRILLETTGYFAWLSREAAGLESVWFQKVGYGLLFWASDPMGSLMIAVAPTAAAGGLAGFAIGALVQRTGRRTALRSWLTGMLVCCLCVAGVVAVAQGLTHPDFVWSPDSVPMLWIPCLIFVVTGSAFTLLLRRRVRRLAPSVQAST